MEPLVIWFKIILSLARSASTKYTGCCRSQYTGSDQDTGGAAKPRHHRPPPAGEGAPPEAPPEGPAGGAPPVGGVFLRDLASLEHKK